jgi:Mor family transcriptional regulator
MALFDDDLVRDILARVVRAAQSGHGGFTDAMAEQIERQVRADWAGSDVHIPRVPAAARIKRDDTIAQLWDSGHHDIRGLAQRFGLSVKQIRRIIDK